MNHYETLVIHTLAHLVHIYVIIWFSNPRAGSTGTLPSTTLVGLARLVAMDLVRPVARTLVLGIRHQDQVVTSRLGFPLVNIQ